MPPLEGLATRTTETQLVLRNAARREIEARLLEWDVIGETDEGPELFERGAFAGTDPSQIVLRLDHLDPPIGRATAIEERADGPYGIFRVARTARGDEGLQLSQPSEDGEPAVYRHVSIGFIRTPPDAYRVINGRRVAIRQKVDTRETSLTWRPAHAGANIVAIRSAEGDSVEMAQAPQAEPVSSAVAAVQTRSSSEQLIENFLDRLQGLEDQLAERSRQMIDLPPATAQRPTLNKGIWAQLALRSLSGERISELEMRALADVITTDNLGVVPPNYQTEMIGFIDPARPFLQSTRQVPAGESGMEQIFPRIVQRPLVGLQTAEKAELPSRKTIIDTATFGVETHGGAGDLSLQLLKRSSPSFLNLWLELLAEAYGIDTDNAALDALLAEAAVIEGGTFDPENPIFSGAFTNAMAVSRSPLLRPDRIWLSTAAFAAFMDAKTPAGGGGTAMYPQLASIAGIGSTGQSGPMPMLLQPVHVPAMDDEAVDVIIGPSRGFAWAEDGTYTLQADVPSKAGRDVGLAGMVWFMPIYPAAFTSYTLPA